MAVLFYSLGLVVMLKALMRCQGAVFLGIMILVTVIVADSPVAGKRTPFTELHNMSHQFVPCIT